MSHTVVTRFSPSSSPHHIPITVTVHQGLTDFKRSFQHIFSGHKLCLLWWLYYLQCFGASLNSTIKGNQPDSDRNTRLVLPSDTFKTRSSWIYNFLISLSALVKWPITQWWQTTDMTWELQGHTASWCFINLLPTTQKIIDFSYKIRWCLKIFNKLKKLNTFNSFPTFSNCLWAKGSQTGTPGP